MKPFIRSAAIVAAIAATQGLAGPGAHGPNGEHLDGPAPVLSAGASVPRVEAKSETFELVARLEGGVLSILIDRYDSNEPVLEAAVEVESGAFKEKATYRREQGDYTIASPQLLQLLATPGTHSLVFTVSAGQDSDLLEGRIQAGAPAPAATAWHRSPGVLGGAVAAVLLVAGGSAFSLRRARRRTP